MNRFAPTQFITSNQLHVTTSSATRGMYSHVLWRDVEDTIYGKTFRVIDQSRDSIQCSASLED